MHNNDKFPCHEAVEIIFNEGHFERHKKEFIGKKQYEGFKPETHEGMKNLIYSALMDEKTTGFKAFTDDKQFIHERYVYVSPTYNMLIIHNSTNPNASSFCRTDKPKKKVRVLERKENDRIIEGKGNLIKIKEGGFYSLHPELAKYRENDLSRVNKIHKIRHIEEFRAKYRDRIIRNISRSKNKDRGIDRGGR